MSFLVVLRHLIVALVVLGLMSGTKAYPVPSSLGEMTFTSGQGQDVGSPCGMMSGMQAADGTTARGKLPCNTIALDCVRKMACLQTAALPERADFSVGSVAFALVTYVVGSRLPTGLTVKPELSPPLAA